VYQKTDLTFLKTSGHPVLINMVPKITFELNNGQTMFYAGSVVAGFVTIELFEDLSNVSEVIVQISGKAYLRWTERKTKRNQRRGRSTTQTQVYSNQENYFKSPVTLLQNIQDHKLRRGQHKFPFSFMIPPNIPASFYFSSGCTAYVYYGLSAKIKRHGLHFNVKEKHQITVLGTTPMSDCPGNPMEPVVARETKFICCWCCKTGPITAEIQLNKTGFVPGETVYCNINIENLSNTELVVTKLNLKRSVFLQSRTKGRTWSDIPVKLDQPGCKSRKTLVLNNVPFQLPVDLAPSMLPFCAIIKPNYFLELEGEIDGCHINLRAPCQLFIAGVNPTGPGYAQPVASDQPPSYQPLAQPSAPAYQPTGYQPPPTNGGYYDWNKPPQPN